MPVTLLYRDDWAASPPKSAEPKPLDLPAKYVVCTSTRKHLIYGVDGGKREMKKLQSHHFSIPECSDIRYNFVICSDGVVYEGRGWNEQPFLPYMFRRLASKSIFIALTGNFQEKRREIPPRMLPALYDLINLGVYLKNIVPEYETYDI